MLATFSFLPIIQAFTGPAGVQRGDPGHLPGRPDPGPVPGPAARGAARSPMRWPSSARWPRRPRPTSSSCRTSRPRCRSSRRRSPSCRARATTCRTTPTTRRPTRTETSGPATTRSRAARSTRCSARATPIAGRRCRSRTYARSHPHSMGAWSPDSKTNVAHMTSDDFRSSETSAVIDEAGVAADRAGRAPTAPRRCCGSRCRCWPARSSTPPPCTSPRWTTFLAEQIARAKAEGVLFSAHLKATMMKVSDPIIFGHVVRAFLPTVFEKYGDVIAAAGLSPNNGLASILAGISTPARGCRDQGRDRHRTAGRAGAGHGRLQQAASPTCTCPATSSSTRRCRR